MLSDSRVLTLLSCNLLHIVTVTIPIPHIESLFATISRQKGAPNQEQTQRVTRKPGITLVKVITILTFHIYCTLVFLQLSLKFLFLCLSLCVSPKALRRQDGGLFKSPPYPGYPFLMIPDLTNPYLSNGALSPSARTVSSVTRLTELTLHPLLFQLFTYNQHTNAGKIHRPFYILLKRKFKGTS